MPRPRKCRRVSHQPPAVLFKPQGIPACELQGVILPLDGLEAMRLVDAEGLSQEEAAGRMEVSRPTLCRILGEARAVVARALANGWAIRFENPECPGTPQAAAGPGGFEPPGPHGRRRGMGRGRGCRLGGAKEES